jgi:hypothetical protein
MLSKKQFFMLGVVIIVYAFSILGVITFFRMLEREKNITPEEYKAEFPLKFEYYMDPIFIYKVNENGNINIIENNQKKAKNFSSNEKSNDKNLQKKLWVDIKNILPQKYMDKVKTYQVYNDNLGNKVAGVEVLNTDGDMNFFIDPADFYLFKDFNSDYFTETMVFTLAFIVGLHPDQIDYNEQLLNYEGEDYKDVFKKYEEECPNYFVKEGCLKDDSYIYTFFKRFWKDNYQHYLDIQDIEDSELFNEKMQEFYNTNKDKFEYENSAESPERDFAESFLSFVLKDKPVDESLIINQKILFFYEYPELVEIKQNINNTINYKTKSNE